MPHSHSPSPHFQGQHVSVLCASNTTSHPCACSRAPCFSVVHVHSGALVFSQVQRACSGAPGLSLVPVSALVLRFSVWSRAFPGSRSQSALPWVPACGPPAPQCRWLLLPGTRAWRLPPPSVYLPISVRGFTIPASYLDTQRWRCSFVKIQMYLPASQADSVDGQAGLVPIQLDSGDRLKKGSPSPLPS